MSGPPRLDFLEFLLVVCACLLIGYVVGAIWPW